MGRRHLVSRPGRVHDTATVTPNRRFAIFIVGSAVAIALVAIPILVASLNQAGGKGQKAHQSEHAITVRGTVQRTTSADGASAYTLAANGTTYSLSDGPVDVIGEVAEGSTEIDVQTIDGKALRAPGRPPWAGGPKVVGEKHPGSTAPKGQGKGHEKTQDKGIGKPEASSSPSSSTSPPPSIMPSASQH